MLFSILSSVSWLVVFQEIENNAILSLCFLGVRQAGANLVSCGGNGWVRFWATGESSTDALKGEFVAHPGGKYADHYNYLFMPLYFEYRYSHLPVLSRVFL